MPGIGSGSARDFLRILAKKPRSLSREFELVGKLGRELGQQLRGDLVSALEPPRVEVDDDRPALLGKLLQVVLDEIEQARLAAAPFAVHCDDETLWALVVDDGSREPRREWGVAIGIVGRVFHGKIRPQLPRLGRCAVSHSYPRYVSRKPSPSANRISIALRATCGRMDS